MGYAQKLDRPATLADLEALPATWRGEIIDSELYAFPRPASDHTLIEGGVFGDLNGAFHRGGRGPGGWWILQEPGVRLPRSPQFSPDVAGWRRERMPVLQRPFITTVPDWVCEVLSPGTRGYDNVVKRRFYAEIGVSHLWYIDPPARSLSVSRLENGRWVELGVHGSTERVRAEPFDAIEIDLAAWWEGLEEASPEDGEPGKLGE